MASHHVSPCALPPRVTPLFQLCARCGPSSENTDGRSCPQVHAQHRCSGDGKATAANRRCDYKIRV